MRFDTATANVYRFIFILHTREEGGGGRVNDEGSLSPFIWLLLCARGNTSPLYCMRWPGKNHALSRK